MSLSAPPSFGLPSFELARVGGGRLGLEELLAEGSTSVVIFWSAVCSHCRRYDGYVNALAERPGVALAAIGCRAGETMQDLEAACEERALRFPLLLDTGGVARGWSVRQTPTAFLLGADGTALYRGAIDDFTLGAERRAYLDDAIAAHQAGRAIELASTSAFGCPVESVYYAFPSVFGEGDGTP